MSDGFVPSTSSPGSQPPARRLHPPKLSIASPRIRAISAASSGRDGARHRRQPQPETLHRSLCAGLPSVSSGPVAMILWYHMRTCHDTNRPLQYHGPWRASPSESQDVIGSVDPEPGRFVPRSYRESSRAGSWARLASSSRLRPLARLAPRTRLPLACAISSPRVRSCSAYGAYHVRMSSSHARVTAPAHASPALG